MVETVRDLFATATSEERLYRVAHAWLVILRDAYHSNREQFSDKQVEFLKRVRESTAHLRRFIDLREELTGLIGLDEYNQGMEELELLSTKLADTAVSKRVKKEIRQLIERRHEVTEFEESKENSRLTNRILVLEENADYCPRGKTHRLQIRQGKNRFFWGCNAFPSCWYTRPLTRDELARLEAPEQQEQI